MFEDDDLLTPEACIFARLRQTTRRVSQIYEEAMRPSGLKSTQFTLLLTLSDTGEINMLRLAEYLDLDRTTLTRNLKPLEKQGCLFIRVDRADRRIRNVGITPHGQEMLAAARPLWRQAQERMIEQLGADSLNLLSLLDKTRLI